MAMSFAELSARLDPSYQSKMGMLREKVQAQYALEEYRAEKQMDVARFNAYESERRERDRAANNRDTERIRGENRIAEMELDLDHRLRTMSAGAALLTTQKILDEQTESRAHFMRQLEERSKLRNDVFKTLAGAVIQEKLAQRQHARDMEKIKAEGAERRSHAYLDTLASYLSRMMERGEEHRARDEIDRLAREWSTEEKISNDISAFKSKNGF
jgi:hypothetical protein